MAITSPAPPHPTIELTMITAVDQSNGMGKNNDLPWNLQNEYAYFTRVTTKPYHEDASSRQRGRSESNRSESNRSEPNNRATSNPVPGQSPAPTNTTTLNAVIMGRKNWYSHPPSMRPLPERINVVITRSPGPVWDDIRASGNYARTHVVGSLEEGVEVLGREYGARGGDFCRSDDGCKEGAVVVGSVSSMSSLESFGSELSGSEEGSEEGNASSAGAYTDSTGGAGQPEQMIRLGRVFVIGGTDIYAAAFQSRMTVRLLLTRIYAGFECDTFFPFAMVDDAVHGVWRRGGSGDLDAWLGESIQRGVVSENGVGYEFLMYERARRLDLSGLV